MNLETKPLYGIAGYRIAKPSFYDVNDSKILNWKQIKIPDKGKGKKTFFDDLAKESAKSLAPNKYSK